MLVSARVVRDEGGDAVKWLWVGVGIVAIPIVVVAIFVVLVTGYVRSNASDAYPLRTEETRHARPESVLASESQRQEHARAVVERGDASQILFGDLHVHSHYSADAAVQWMQIRDREAAHPPADACDFARFCSGLDFWSINDHAEGLTPEMWKETVESIRSCNEIAGDPNDPDMVSFLGWEWSQMGTSPESHYGHKNVVLRGTADAEIPTRPIASAPNNRIFYALGLANSLMERDRVEDYRDFHRALIEEAAVEICPNGVAVRDLPSDCREVATTPRALFDKLSEWDLPAIVIPHGLSWGITNPVHADLALQLTAENHDPRWQSLIEVYSGHGNSEVYADFERPTQDAAGKWSCPSGGEGIELCCERAAELARARCTADQDCDAEVAQAVQTAASIEGGMGFSPPTSAVPGTTVEDWGACGQFDPAFLPAKDYRPRMSAQYGLAVSDVDESGMPIRFRPGFIGSSDTHRGRGGTGYKEFARLAMTDGVGYLDVDGADAALDSRGSSFYYTGGLVAAHAGSRDRNAIFDALQARNVYGTSGARILLYFDLVMPNGERRPMGSEVALATTPRFEVRAVGSFKQNPGCPEYVSEALTPERLESLCLGECYHPSDERHAITRLEVVRIRPQESEGEAVAPLIEDPWRVLSCDGNATGCVARFDDPEFAQGGRETSYYVRAIQALTPAVNGDPLRCERDESGRCVRGHPCGEREDGTPEDCLAPVEERAWSSPIFVKPTARVSQNAG